MKINETDASTRDTSRDDAPDEGVWLSVTEAAARVGVSEKTLRKRISAGTVEAEKVALDGGGWKWQVLAQRLEAVGTVGSQNDADLNSQRLEVPAGSNRSADVPTVPTAALPTASKRSHGDENDLRVLAAETENAMLREALEREREAVQRERENADQWRAQVEAANRQAAEATASVRELTRALNSFKALPGGEYSQDGRSAQNDEEARKGGAAGKEVDEPKIAQQRAPARQKLNAWQRVIARTLGIRL
jgi:hypothetical protein